jgi:GlpG protein
VPDDFDYSAPPRRDGINRPANPILTPLLCIACVIITLAYWTPNSPPGTLWYVIGHFSVQSSNAIWDGRYYALLTSFFVHGGIAHILFNMLWLWRLGNIVETSIPLWKYLLFMVGAAFVGSCCEIAVSGQTGVGASGVVYAIFGLMWAGRGAFTSWRQVATRDNLNIFIGWGVLCIFLTYSHIMPIANGAHWGGFVYGLAIGWLCFAPRRQPVWGIALAALGVVCIMALTWLPWSWEWKWHQGNKEFDRKHYAQAISDYQSSLKLGGDQPSLWQNIAAAWHNTAFEAAKTNDSAAMEHALQQEQEADQRAGIAKQTTEPEATSSDTMQEPQKKLIDPRAKKD